MEAVASGGACGKEFLLVATPHSPQLRHQASSPFSVRHAGLLYFDCALPLASRFLFVLPTAAPYTSWDFPAGCSCFSTLVSIPSTGPTALSIACCGWSQFPRVALVYLFKAPPERAVDWNGGCGTTIFLREADVGGAFHVSTCFVCLALRGDPLGGRGAMRGKHSRARRGRRGPKSPRPPQLDGSRPPVCGRARAAPRSSRQIRCTGRGRCRIF